jgi:hypothetical protein
VKKGNSNEGLISLVLTGDVKSEEYGTWWEGYMTTILSQVRRRGSAHGIKRLLPVFLSTIWNKLMQRRKLGESFKRLEWTCVSHKLLSSLLSPILFFSKTDHNSQKCGHRSHDDFPELSPGATIELANDMFKAGYITQAQISGQTKSPASSLIINVQNTFNGV